MADPITSLTKETFDAHTTPVPISFEVNLPSHVDRGPNANRGPNDTTAFKVAGEVPARAFPRWVGGC